MSKLLKSVTRIDGALMKRPRGPHPDLEHWARVCDARRKLQNNQCATCPASGEHYRLEGHHKHYDTWGKESLEDIVLLCPCCHEAITSRIRRARFARGDQSLHIVDHSLRLPIVPRPKVRTIADPGPIVEKVPPQRFRPARRKINL